MSRIRGTYRLRFSDETVVRWLDTTDGRTYDTAVGGSQMATGFERQGGVWQAARYTFVPDAPEPANWYVIRMVPDLVRGRPVDAAQLFSAFGPYTEAQARETAAMRSGRHGIRYDAGTPYAVFQIQDGDTVKVAPPAPPAPVAHWS